MRETVRADIVDNRVRDARLNAINLVDLGNSTVRIEDNVISSGAVGMFIFRGGRPSDEPTIFTVEHNRFAITDRSSDLFGFPSEGILFIDITPEGGIDRLLIRENRIALLPLGFLGFFDGIFITGDRGGVRIVRNEIAGPVIFAGIFVENSVGNSNQPQRLFRAGNRSGRFRCLVDGHYEQCSGLRAWRERSRRGYR